MESAGFKFQGFGIITNLLLILFNIATGIAALVIGYIDTNITFPEYPINIQAWLIVAGLVRISSIFSLIELTCSFRDLGKQAEDDDKQANKVGRNGFFFSAVWLIYGTVLIARGNWIHNRLFNLAFALIIIDWVLCGIILIAACCIGCCVFMARKN